MQTSGIQPKRIRAVAAAAGLALAIGLAAAPAFGVGLSAQEAQDRASIQETMSRYMFALDTANADAYAAVYAPDGEIVIGGKVLEKGRPALHAYIEGLRKQWKMTPDQKFGKTRHIYYNFTVEVHGDTALAQAYWTTLLADPKGGAAWKALDTGVSENSLVKINGSWLIAKRVIIPDPAPKPAAAAEK
jgi:uncharacterized protein (TIGR02246 family)